MGLVVPMTRVYKDMNDEEKRVLFQTLFEQHIEKGSLSCNEC